MVSCPSLKDDHLFMTDMATAIAEAVTDTNLTVRARASWAAGNLFDAVSDTLPNPAFINERLLLKFSQALLTGTKDNDKVSALVFVRKNS